MLRPGFEAVNAADDGAVPAAALEQHLQEPKEVETDAQAAASERHL